MKTTKLVGSNKLYSSPRTQLLVHAISDVGVLFLRAFPAPGGCGLQAEEKAIFLEHFVTHASVGSTKSCHV